MLNSFPNERQLDTMDCGAACLKMIAKYYGYNHSLQFFREHCGTTKEGASMLNLSYVAESIGLRTISVVCTLKELLSVVAFPCIAHWNNNHFIVVYNTEKYHIRLRSSQRLCKL